MSHFTGGRINATHILNMVKRPRCGMNLIRITKILENEYDTIHIFTVEPKPIVSVDIVIIVFMSENSSTNFN